jgi:hypothetical protein
MEKKISPRGRSWGVTLYAPPLIKKITKNRAKNLNLERTFFFVPNFDSTKK